MLTLKKYAKEVERMRQLQTDHRAGNNPQLASRVAAAEQKIDQYTKAIIQQTPQPHPTLF
jgi:hypothetical protein